MNPEQLAYQPQQQNIFYQTTANEIGKEQPNDFEISLKFDVLFFYHLSTLVLSLGFLTVDISQNLEFL